MNVEKFNPKFPYKIKLEVEWPKVFYYEEFKYFFVLTGTRLTDGCPSAKYWRPGDYSQLESYIWLNLDGTVTEE
jgi:hypothetical protein